MERSALYEQATGLFLICSPLPFRAVGYAGRGRGRNNPDLQSVKNTGPLPVGSYRVSLPYSDVRKGPLVFRLTPEPSNAMYGRGGFLIHGDNVRGDASEGCIILGRADREMIARQNVRRLTVVRLLPCASLGGCEAANLTIDAQVTPSSDGVA